ncbi:MAG TPA: metallophosphoesterase, partial [bacterium]|nr:metallophosphoesterase [bacterium]
AAPTPTGSVTVDGGKLDDLIFAIVGDTRPMTVDDTASYPTLIITRIFQALEAASPRPFFAVTTGDYMFASNGGGQAGPQLDKYVTARESFTNPVFPAMGNHECTGYTDSNCGPGALDGTTNQFLAYQQRFLAPLGLANPWYAVRVDDKNGAWSAKFVFVAANAWNAEQATWLDQALADPTTYTFVVRHEPGSASTAPGVTPSANIITNHPITLVIEGHTHTYYHSGTTRELVVGNGGAPITSSVNYGYVMAHRRPADGAIVFEEHDYDTGTITDTFAINADGSAAP